METKFAKLADATELAKIDLIAHSELKWWNPNSRSDFISIIKNKKQVYITAKEKGKIIGYLSLRKDKDSRWLWLEDIYVLKEWRNKGIAKTLIKEALKYKNRKTPKRKMVLLTADRNLNIFKKLGFKKTMNFMES